MKTTHWITIVSLVFLLPLSVRAQSSLCGENDGAGSTHPCPDGGVVTDRGRHPCN